MGTANTIVSQSKLFYAPTRVCVAYISIPSSSFQLSIVSMSSEMFDIFFLKICLCFMFFTYHSLGQGFEGQWLIWRERVSR